MRGAVAIAVALVTAATAPAWADDGPGDKPVDDPDLTAPPTDDEPVPAGRPDTGYIGGPTRTPEVNACRAPTDVAPAELRARASEHYQRGNTLYVQGDYDGAIEEFVAAYCDAPHYEMLKNIAQSFERELDYGKAVAYLSRYILEMPKDDPALAEQMEQISFRVQVLSNLPARVRVATVPPGARITLVGETGVNARGVAGDRKPLEVRKGSYELRVELEGYEPISEKIEVEIGQPYSYYFRLEPKRGTMRVIADPSGARIFVDKKLVGIGTYTERVPIGVHSVTVEADGRKPGGRRIEVTADRTSTVTIRLPHPARSGRRQLLVASTLSGSLFAGGAMTTVFDDPRLGALGGLLGLGIGFGGGYYGVPSDIPVGQSSYIIGSTFIGAGEGLALSYFLACDPQVTGDARCNQIVGGATVAAGVAGLLWGAITADNFDLDAGDAALVNSGAQWGTVGGLLFVGAFDNDRRLYAPLGFAGLNLGLVAGSLLARRLDVSRGHVALIDLSGLAGMIAGVALVDVIQPGQRSDRLPHFALLGMTAGLITGGFLTRNMDEPAAPVRAVAPAVSGARDASGRLTPVFGMSARF